MNTLQRYEYFFKHQIFLEKMIKQSIFLEKYDWNITLTYDVKKENLPQIIKIFTKHKAKKDIIDKVVNNIVTNKHNNGITYSKNRNSIVIIGSTSNKPNFANTLTHEIFHLAIHIAKEYNINPYGEEIAYISGDIAEKTLPLTSHFLCEKCNH